MRNALYLALCAVILSGCENQDEYQTSYDEGYGKGLEDQRMHICNAIENSDDHAFEVLQDERICQ